ncbi:hypothetical protein C8R45DRAFT_940998 [Mycena sanguinolenta]|nr:hypothetical protein C8R45DRAFT_940998 [Mycena sanguinolenta]
MSAAPARSQKPLLLPGIAPHLFQSRAAARPQRPNPMLAKNDSVAGPVLDHDAEHPRTPSDGSTAVATTQDDVDARRLEKLRALATRMDTIQAQLQQLQDRQNWAYLILRAVGARLGSAWASLRDTLRFIVLWLLFTKGLSTRIDQGYTDVFVYLGLHRVETPRLPLVYAGRQTSAKVDRGIDVQSDVMRLASDAHTCSAVTSVFNAIFVWYLSIPALSEHYHVKIIIICATKVGIPTETKVDT